MAKKLTSIVKKSNKNDSNSNELFNLNEEIIIGINSKKVENTKNTSKNKKSTKKRNSKNQNKINNNTTRYKKQESKLEKKKSHKILKIFILIVLLVIAIILFLLSPLFNINKISVVNNKNISDEEIISLSGIQIGTNTFKYVNFDLIEKIKINPHIKEVKITRQYPSEIVIDVIEREVSYFIRFNEKFAYIDSQGYIVEILGENREIPEVIGFKTSEKDIVPGNRLVEDDLIQLGKIIDIYNYMITNEIADRVLSFVIEDDRIMINLKDDKIVYIENFTNMNIKMLSLKVILEKNEGKSGKIYLDGQGEIASPLFRENV